MKKKVVLLSISIFACFVISLGLCYGIVSWNAYGRTFDKAEDVPVHEYGVLLGTSPITPQGAHNFYFDNRIKAAVELYNASKIKKIIASGGDYSNRQNNGYNELEAMRDSLIAHGVKIDDIILDYDGLRTINSIVKVKEKMMIDSCIIISQEYHNQRAIWQAEHYGLKVVGYNAKPSHIRRNRIKNIAREIFARPKMFLDLWFGCKPNFNDGFIFARATQKREPQELFGITIQGSELEILHQLANASILHIDSIVEDNGIFKYAIVEFGGVKFGLNPGFVFNTSQNSQQAVKAIVDEITKYYGNPTIDNADTEIETQYRYYEWNKIKVRPLHSEDGGTVMFWYIGFNQS